MQTLKDASRRTQIGLGGGSSIKIKGWRCFDSRRKDLRRGRSGNRRLKCRAHDWLGSATTQTREPRLGNVSRVTPAVSFTPDLQNDELTREGPLWRRRPSWNNWSLILPYSRLAPDPIPLVYGPADVITPQQIVLRDTQFEVPGGSSTLILVC